MCVCVHISRYTYICMYVNRSSHIGKIRLENTNFPNSDHVYSTHWDTCIYSQSDFISSAIPSSSQLLRKPKPQCTHKPSLPCNMGVPQGE